MISYLDTSAFLKLVVDEEHSAALRAGSAGRDLWSSTLLDVEAHRAARRLDVDVAVVEEALCILTLIVPVQSTFAAARTAGPESVRILDALHLVAALELGSDLDVMITYDRRLAAGAAACSLQVESPGLPRTWWRE